MRYVAAYLLAVLGGNKAPALADLEKILGSVGIEVDKERANKVIKELSGKDVNEVMQSGKSKLASMPAGGGVAAPSGGGGGGAPAAAAAAASPAKEAKEAKKEESESEDDDMGFGLFD